MHAPCNLLKGRHVLFILDRLLYYPTTEYISAESMNYEIWDYIEFHFAFTIQRQIKEQTSY